MVILCPHCGQTHEVNLGYLMGKTKSEKKAKAVRENGKLGGRPKKPITSEDIKHNWDKYDQEMKSKNSNLTW